MTRSTQRRIHRSWLTRHVRTVAVAGVVALLGATAAQGPALAATHVSPTLRAVDRGKKVKGHAVRTPAAVKETASSRSEPTPAATWPQAGTYLVTLPHEAAGTTRNEAEVATSLPLGRSGVTVRLAAQAMGAAAPSVVVTVLNRAQAAAASARGLAFEVRQTNKALSSVPITLSVPRSLLQGLFGADYASRVQWESPEAGVATASSRLHAAANPATSDMARLPSTNSGTASTLELRATQTPQLVMAASGDSSSSGTGTFGATSLSPTSQVLSSAQTGDFAWSYPMQVPPDAAGPSPQLALSYDSQSVDGETGSTNNQPSEIGDGWQMQGAGFVERTYVPCSLDDGSSGPVTSSGDLCWKTDNATISLAGHSGSLVKDASTGVWKLEDDDGTRVEHLTTCTNGTYDHDCWRITTPDGTQYYFGLNELPGWASGDATTNSAWTVPVYGNDPGEPCHASSFAASSCTQAWRWNLDYVVDPHGNSEAYYYTPETNWYDSDGATPVSYDRGGYLTRIDYGMRAGSELTTTAPDQVIFTNVSRCLTTCTNNANWPDTPMDLVCSSASCASSFVSPAFFTEEMLSQVQTKITSGGTTSVVGTWVLTHTFPDPGDGTSPALWLTEVQHTGGTPGASGAISEPLTYFSGITMENRVWVTDGLAPLDKYRISSITTSTGAQLLLTYSAAQCSQSDVAPIEANPEANAKLCFPQWWSPSDPPQAPQEDLFNKFVLTQLVTDPHTGGSADAQQTTTFDYSEPFAGVAATAAWRYDNSPLVPDDERTWSVWAGYSSVEVRQGSSPATELTTDYLFFQGLDGERAAPSGGTISHSVTGTDGVAVTDSLWLAGRTRETQVRNGDGGTVLSDAITTAAVSGPTSNDGTLDAYQVNNGLVVTTSPLSTGGTRTVQTKTVYDSYDRPTSVANITTDAGTTCTKTTYDTNTATNMLDYPSEVATVDVNCATTPSYPANAISDVRDYYDGATSLTTPPTKGDITQVTTVNGYTGSTPTWIATATNVYDALGRETKTTDSLNRSTSTAYTPATSGPLTETVNTNPLGWTTTTLSNPAWGVETSVTDANGHVTTATYDALGRRIGVWYPNRLQSANTTPSVAYSYTLPTITVSNNVVTVTGMDAVETGTIEPNNNVQNSYTLYDGLGNVRQTQAPSPDGGSIVIDTGYDATGKVVSQSDAYTESSAPSATLFVPGTTIPGETTTTYDGAGRLLISTQIVDGDAVWSSTHAYPGVDETTVTPPTGGTPTATYTDGRGRIVRLLQYHGTTPTGTADTTLYAYDVRGDRTKITSPAGNVWSYSYNVQGQETTAVDPDTGTTTTAYDSGGRVTEVDSATSDLWYTYDALDRKTAEYSNPTIASPRSATNPATGSEQASWVYDTLEKGDLTSSTRYVGSTAGTPGAAYTETATGYNTLDESTGTTLTIPVGALAGNLAGSYTTSFGYASDGSPSTTNDAAEGGLPAETITDLYDSYGQQSEVAGSQLYLGSIEWTGIGQVASDKAGSSSMSSEQTYFYQDGTGRLTQTQVALTASGASSSVTAANDVYSYDNAGDETSDTNTTAASTDQQCFSYDYDQRLTTAWTPSSGNCTAAPSSSNLGGPSPYWSSYNYDADSDRTSAVQHATTTGGSDTTNTYGYNASGASATQPHAVQTVMHQTGTTNTGTDTYGYNASGQTTAIPGHTLGYDAEGRLVTDTTAAGTETRIYDADGDLLLQSSPTGIELWNGDTELKADSSGNVTGVRTYSGLGKTVAERTTTAGVSGSSLYELETDRNGTITQSIATTTAMTVTNRYDDPFGNPRDSTSGLPDDKSFLGDWTDSASGLVAVGERTYDPTLGRFLTVDPEMEADSPQQLNGYSYAANDPISSADPAGLSQLYQGGGGPGSAAPPPAVPQAPPSPGKTLTGSASDSTVLEYVGGLGACKSTPSDSSGPSNPVLDEVDFASAQTAAASKRHHDSWFDIAAKAVAGSVVAPVDAGLSVGAGVANTVAKTVTGGAVNLNLQPCFDDADASICRFGRDVGNGLTYVGVQFVPGADELADEELAEEGVVEGVDVLDDAGGAGSAVGSSAAAAGEGAPAAGSTLLEEATDPTGEELLASAEEHGFAGAASKLVEDADDWQDAITSTTSTAHNITPWAPSVPSAAAGSIVLGAAAVLTYIAHRGD
jgi:RHS repeat-associated protein